MVIDLSSEQARELQELLETTLGDLSYEIAATDNPTYRTEVMQRRDRLRDVLGLLKETPGTTAVSKDAPAVLKELSHPGG